MKISRDNGRTVVWPEGNDHLIPPYDALVWPLMMDGNLSDEEIEKRVSVALVNATEQKLAAESDKQWQVLKDEAAAEAVAGVEAARASVGDDAKMSLDELRDAVDTIQSERAAVKMQAVAIDGKVR